MSLEATTIGFEKNFADDSGIEFAIRLTARGTIEFEDASATSTFDATDIDWIVEALQRIQKELA